MKTIDSKGNIIERPVGPSRWASPRRYRCGHRECNNDATVLRPSAADVAQTHNCCRGHDNCA